MAEVSTAAPVAGQQVQGNRPLRELMPETAAIFDMLRLCWGKEQTDRLVRRMAAGEPVGHVAEIGADGQLRVFGRSREGRQWQAVEQADGTRQLVQIERDGRRVPSTAELPRIPARLWSKSGKEIKA